MKRKDVCIWLCRILIVLNLCFIWGNSLLPAEVSKSFSDWAKAVLDTILTDGTPAPSGSGLLRKIAHFTEFASLGLLTSCLLVLRQKRIWPALLFGISAACVDETIQFFVPGRSPGLLDVGIDTCGVITGMILLQIGYVLWKQNKSKQYGGKQ